MEAGKSTLRCGDIVCLAHSKLTMTVIELVSGIGYRCDWYDQHHRLCTSVFPYDALRRETETTEIANLKAEIEKLHTDAKWGREREEQLTKKLGELRNEVEGHKIAAERIHEQHTKHHAELIECKRMINEIRKLVALPIDTLASHAAMAQLAPRLIKNILDITEQYK